MRFAAGALATLCLASACGASARSQGTTTAAHPPQPPPASTTCTSAGHSLCVTAGARGHTHSIATGWRLMLRLQAPGRSFGVPTQQGSALRRLAPASRSDGAVTVAYRAVRVGSVQLRALERPRCRAGAVCPQFIVLWTLTVRVTRR
jgi:hypothetical protein